MNMKQIFRLILVAFLCVGFTSRSHAQEFYVPETSSLNLEASSPDSYLTVDLIMPTLMTLSLTDKKSSGALYAGAIGWESKMSQKSSHWLQFEYMQLGASKDYKASKPMMALSSCLKYFLGGEVGSGFYLRTKLAGVYFMDEKDDVLSHVKFHAGGGVGLGFNCRFFGMESVRFYLDAGVKYMIPIGEEKTDEPKEKLPKDKKDGLSTIVTSLGGLTEYLYLPNRVIDLSCGISIAL